MKEGFKVNEYSLSDLAAITKDNDTFGGNGAWWLILLFLFWGFNGNNFCNRQGELGQYATAASQQQILFNQQFDQLNQRLTNIGNGICDSTFALNNTITTEGRNLSSQLAQCFKSVLKAIKSFCTNNAVGTCAV